MKGVTQQDLKKILDYNPDTGLLRWRVDVNYNAKAGSIAGHKHGTGYIKVSIKRKSYQAHRLIWLYLTGEWPSQVDHINHIKDDNRSANLRESTQHENNKNASMRRDNKSGVVGVHWVKRYEKWAVQVGVCNSRKHLGYFKDKLEAICTRKSAENKYGFHANHGS